MHYDFDRKIERRGTDSTKWNRDGADILPLWVADMDFPSPEPVIEALRQRVEHRVFGYGMEPPDLRAAVQERMERLFGWKVEAGDLRFLPGVVVGFNLAAGAFGEKGDQLLIQPPVYPPFFAAAKYADRTLARAPLTLTDTGYEIDFDAFEQAITPRTKVFILCNPHNPVGRVFTRSELERLAEICLRHDVIICSDEIHQDFVYPGHIHIPMASLAPEVARRTITLISPSKSFNIAGFHFSIAVAQDPEVRAKLDAAEKGLIPKQPGILDIVAGLAAYSHGEGWMSQVMEYLRGSRDFLVEYVRENMPGVRTFTPEGTYLAWLDCREAGLSCLPGEFFMDEARVALMEGKLFGSQGEGFVRLNFGCPRSTLTEALESMRDAMARAASGEPALGENYPA